jgi:hypothetical protein
LIHILKFIGTIIDVDKRIPPVHDDSADTALMPPVTDTDPPADLEAPTDERSGSTFIVDVIKPLGFEYIRASLGSSFQGLHESLIRGLKCMSTRSAQSKKIALSEGCSDD